MVNQQGIFSLDIKKKINTNNSMCLSIKPCFHLNLLVRLKKRGVKRQSFFVSGLPCFDYKQNKTKKKIRINWLREGKKKKRSF